LSSPFRSWNGVEAHEFAPGVTLHAVGGEQVLMCRVSYDAGAVIPLHDHPEAEQLMYVVDGDVTLVVGSDERELRSGDVAVINRGVEHELWTDGGCTFIEALSPGPRDHVPDPERDLVLGSQGDALHVDR
jgi:quercetin dioxygenase-like cupin family protein